MARVTNSPETAVYQFRKRVRRDVLALVGGPPIVKESLWTKDRDEAKRLFKEVEAKYEARWAQVRLRPRRHPLDRRSGPSISSHM